MAFIDNRKKNVKVAKANYPQALRDLLKQSDVAEDKLFVNLILSHGYNHNKSVADWEKDSFITLAEEKTYRDKANILGVPEIAFILLIIAGSGWFIKKRFLKKTA